MLMMVTLRLLKVLKPRGGTGPLLHEAVVPFHDVVQVFALTNLDRVVGAYVVSRQRSGVGATATDGGLAGCTGAASDIAELRGRNCVRLAPTRRRG
jgi:hypothetical protein